MATYLPARLRNLFGPADDLGHPLWNTRLSPTVCAVFFLLAETVFRTGKAHTIVLAMGWVQMYSLSVAMFKAKDIVTSSSHDALFRPIWILRILPILCAAAMVAPDLLHLSANAGDALLGFSCGLLLTILVVGFSITEVIPRASQTRDEFQQLHLTR